MEGRPETADLLDKFGRVARDLRVSITSACSLRCTYCMPAEGLPVIPTRDLLSADEIGRLVGIAVHDLGVREVRFTGGEPLTRPDLVDIIRASSSVAPGVPLAMTTNGVGLDRKAAALAEAGLTRINVSLDTIDREHFAAVTRRDRLPAVLRGLDAARAAGLGPIKINAVALRETLPDAGDLLAWALSAGVRLRFIEQMPLDADETWRRENLVSAAELLEELGRRFTLTPAGRDDPQGTHHCQGERGGMTAREPRESVTDFPRSRNSPPTLFLPPSHLLRCLIAPRHTAYSGGRTHVRDRPRPGEWGVFARTFC